MTLFVTCLYWMEPTQVFKAGLRLLNDKTWIAFSKPYFHTSAANLPYI